MVILHWFVLWHMTAKTWLDRKNALINLKALESGWLLDKLYVICRKWTQLLRKSFEKLNVKGSSKKCRPLNDLYSILELKAQIWDLSLNLNILILGCCVQCTVSSTQETSWFGKMWRWISCVSLVLLYCLLWFQLCSQYLCEVNSCYSTTGLCYSNISQQRWSYGHRFTALETSLRSRLTGTQQEKLIHVLSQFQKVSIPGFFPFHLQRHISNF